VESSNPIASIAEALARAVQFHRKGEVDAARPIYEQILESDPDQVDALHFLGLLTHQTGDSHTAMQLIARAITLQPGNAAAHSNLGNVLKELGELEDARTSYENALACDPYHVETHNNLGVLLRYLGEMKLSLEHLMTAVLTRPDWGIAHFNLGNTYASTRLTEHAQTHYRRAIELDPKLTQGYRLLGASLHALGKPEEAETVFRRLIALDPGNPVGEHMLAACHGGDAVPDRASEAFVVQTFDEFAASFEVQLARIGYRGPQLVADALQALVPEAAGRLRMLDAGCGTGLCGPLLRPFAEYLVGVDLSPGMLSRARLRDCYDELIETDLVAFLKSGDDRFDVIASADTLIYFGELREVFTRAYERLVPGGLLIFTLEQGPEAHDYHLFVHGRYGHGRDYVATRLRGAGLELVRCENHEIRTELGQPVAGWVVSARRPTRELA
jgi:predicted TPR repeat methyltransferase